MGSSSGLAGLKCVQFLFRGIEFGLSAIILGIYSYYLATMISHGLDVPTSVKAVEGISAVGTIYTVLGVLLVCCCAGFPASSFISSVIDIGLIGAYVYIAVANRAGASSCTGNTVDTVYGSGDAGATPGGTANGDMGLPTFQIACQLEKVCIIASSVAILFFIFSIFLEFRLNRNRYRANRPIRDADGEYVTKSDHYTGSPPPQRRDGRTGLRGLGAFRRGGAAPPNTDPDALPINEMQYRQFEVPTWGEVSSVHDSDRLYFNDGESRDEHGPPVRMTSTTAPRPAADEYVEGDTRDVEYEPYREDKHGNDHTEIGHVSKQRENRAARAERYAAA